MDSENLITRPIRVFISYSSDDKIIAGDIKNHLTDYGFDVFLAHEDIEPSSEWQKEIIRNLRNCDVFVPIVSVKFKESKWTDQEVGFALAFDKLIIPIDFGQVPYGFIGKYQALKLKDDVSDACKKIIDLILTRPNLKEIIDNHLIKSFIESRSFDEANRIADTLSTCEPFTDTQVKMIIKGYFLNDQIRGAFKARPTVIKLFEKYKDRLPPLLAEQFEIFATMKLGEKRLAMEKMLLEFIKKNGETSQIEILSHFDFPNLDLFQILNRLVINGELQREMKLIKGQRQFVYSLKNR